MVALVLDTGPLLAAFDAADPDREACAALLTEAGEDLVVPALVLGRARLLVPAHVDALALLP